MRLPPISTAPSPLPTAHCPLPALLLAAGTASRFGSQKLLAPIAECPLVRVTVEHLLSAGVTDVFVVVGRDAAAVREALGDLPVRFVENPHFAEGMSTSLIHGVRAIPPAADGVLVALGDQPFLEAEVASRLIIAWRESGLSIVVPVYDGERGHPVIFSRSLFPELLEVTGDLGAREVVARDPSRVELVPFPFAPPTDVDTPEDYERLRRGLRPRIVQP